GILKTRLKEQLEAEKKKKIQHLRIATPSHHSELLDFFSSCSLKIENITVETTIESLNADNWIDKALSTDALVSVKLRLLEMNNDKSDIAKSIIDRCLTMKKASIELFEEANDASMSLIYGFRPLNLQQHYIDKTLITGAYLLDVAKTMKLEIELDITLTLLSLNGILAVSKAISTRTDAARLRFQMDDKAREMKAKILNKWGVSDVIKSKFLETNKPRNTPIKFKHFTLYNEGCERVCIYDGRIVLKVPTEFALDGKLGIILYAPHRFTIERVIDANTQLGLNRGYFEVSQK
ncbi:hypothetical protein PENTCL1PPCAC_16450, partial [Pristionchus entomophagus]